MAEGLSNKEIAAELGIAVNTTKVYIHNLLFKFGCKRRDELAERYKAAR